MLDRLLPYYERELAEFRQLGAEFAQTYPKIARRLQLEPEHCADPHVERLLEASAFMAARIHHRLDEDYPEITEAFLQAMYPHYLRPVPSTSIVQANPDPKRTGFGTSFFIPRGSAVESPLVTKQTKCLFRTSFDLDVHPLEIQSARLELTQASDYLRRITPHAAVLTLKLENFGQRPISELNLSQLRFFLDGDASLTSLLYELMTTRLANVRVHDGSDDPQKTLLLPKEALRPMGFLPEESLLPTDSRTLDGHRLLSEYFAFPDKFMFIEVGKLNHSALQSADRSLVIQFIFSQYPDSERHNRLAKIMAPAFFKLNCTPIINLFERSATPIRVDDRRSTYAIQPSQQEKDSFEIYAINEVRSVERKGHTDNSIVPALYGAFQPPASQDNRIRWVESRKPSTRPQDTAFETEIGFVHLDKGPIEELPEVYGIEVTCTNRNLCQFIPFSSTSSDATDFTFLDGASKNRCALLRKPTPTLRISSRQGYQWRLIAHLSLNHTSFVKGGKESIQRMLSLYNITDSATLNRQIQGLVELKTESGVTRLPGKGFPTFVRGLEVHLTFDENHYVGANMFLFGMILEQFFAQCSPPNSFVRMHMHSRQREGEIVAWPPRTGDGVLL